MIWKFFKRKTYEETSETALSNADIESFRNTYNRGTSLLSSMIQPDDIRNAERFIRVEFSLYSRWQGEPFQDALRTTEIKAVKQIPGLPSVFMFHGDGLVREAALNQLHEPLTTPACVYGLFWRLNDWAPQVRQAAQNTLNRLMTATPAVVIVPVLRILLPHVMNWGRWTQEGQEALDVTLTRPDVLEMLIDDIVTTRQAQLSYQFREICRNPAVDQHLERMLYKAQLPHIRTMALDALLSQTVIWPTRERRKVCIDRYMGRYRIEQVFLKRDVTVNIDPYSLIAAGALDRAAIVRKRAASGLIAFRNHPEIGSKLDEIAASLKNDPSAAVRGRIDFYKRKRSEEGTPI
ncbi:hypothetical protein HBA92_08790 [Ochrobactrum sp. MR28]|nr:hypothetical protein [Ochrobactrum sp. MR28]MBX8815047.1 hypothetical protein [Ochrobactrum sp. MR31]